MYVILRNKIMVTLKKVIKAALKILKNIGLLISYILSVSYVPKSCGDFADCDTPSFTFEVIRCETVLQLVMRVGMVNILGLYTKSFSY